jgi:hypothetical protein
VSTSPQRLTTSSTSRPSPSRRRAPGRDRLVPAPRLMPRVPGRDARLAVPNVAPAKRRRVHDHLFQPRHGLPLRAWSAPSAAGSRGRAGRRRRRRPSSACRRAVARALAAAAADQIQRAPVGALAAGAIRTDRLLAARAGGPRPCTLGSAGESSRGSRPANLVGPGVHIACVRNRAAVSRSANARTPGLRAARGAPVVQRERRRALATGPRWADWQEWGVSRPVRADQRPPTRRARLRAR